ncbi:farnesyl diphosphate synthase [Erysipelothrix rhusiopathiae]|uniref:polyprenyl synthetase family protein n=1 Tax=Erysipelothrix rhusiopathiae TaxID=1648 RepID=UPI002B247241|nr:farnesyl diphosphate synthase [Erysipelothrix rhusiopathiae]WRB92371.1 polyprenyl synthetase family protein [Erysipelothrix rhusiopathiae]
MIKDIDARLDAILEYYPKTSVVREAMTYSLMSGGKRLRPRLLLAMLEDFGCDYKLGLNPACALEMVHTYSLVHDDLPAMDDDDLRRFKPTNHKVFGEGVAILAGDALLTGAFTALSQSSLDSDVVGKCLEILARNAGNNGMILGQELDIDDHIDHIDDLVACYNLKTGCLFAGAFEMAAVISGKDSYQKLAHDLGLTLGVAFQFQDDLLEVTKTSEQIGKSNQSDADRDKTTVVSLLGVEQARTLTESYFSNIKDLLKQMNIENGNLKQIIDEMMSREL